MANSYRVTKMHTRKKLSKEDCLIRLSDEWAYTKSYRNQVMFYHTISIPEKETMAWQYYINFEGQRWHEAGPEMYRNKIRKVCFLCKKRVPVPLRVMFTLKGK